jgi:multiple sugar transport system permease protein
MATTHAPELPRKPRRLPRSLADHDWFGSILVAPAMLIILFFALFPLGYAIYLAGHYVDLTSINQIGDFVGLTTLTILVIALTTEVLLGVGLAMLLNRLKWFKGPCRALFLLPLACAPEAAALIWRYLYDSDFGVYNALLAMIGLGPINWLGSSLPALTSIIIFDVWQWTPFVTLITLAALQALPREPFEAAELDGASRFTVFRRLTLPLLTPVLALILVLRGMDLARLYDPVAAMTKGGPGSATETVSYYLYRVGLEDFRLDQASAMALLVLFVIVVVSGLGLRPLMRAQGARARRG